MAHSTGSVKHIAKVVYNTIMELHNVLLDSKRDVRKEKFVTKIFKAAR